MTYKKKPNQFLLQPALMECGLIMLKRDLFFSTVMPIRLATEKPATLKNLLESFEDVNEIPLNGIFVQNGNHTTDVYFYSEESNPYRNATLDLEALKQYNRFIYPLSILLNQTCKAPAVNCMMLHGWRYIQGTNKALVLFFPSSFYGRNLLSFVMAIFTARPRIDIPVTGFPFSDQYCWTSFHSREAGMDPPDEQGKL